MYWDLYVQILKELDFNEREIDMMVHSNAIRVYRLDEKPMRSKL